MRLILPYGTNNFFSRRARASGPVWIMEHLKYVVRARLRTQLKRARDFEKRIRLDDEGRPSANVHF
jgi:hypothetical protein